MSNIWNITRNLMHHKVLVKLSNFVSGFLKKIINNFLGLIRMFRGTKGSITVCASPIDQDMNIGLLSEVDHKKEHTESSSNFIQELERDTKAEEPEAPGEPLIQPEVKREYVFCGYCYSGDHKAKFCPSKHYICRDCGTLFPCEKKDVHGEERKVLNYCFDCRYWGHLSESCPERDNLDVDFDPSPI